MDEQIMFEIAKSLNTIAGCMEARQKKEEENSNSAEKTQPSGETNKQSTPCKKMISCGLLYDSELCDNGFRECYE